MGHQLDKRSMLPPFHILNHVFNNSFRFTEPMLVQNDIVVREGQARLCIIYEFSPAKFFRLIRLKMIMKGFPSRFFIKHTNQAPDTVISKHGTALRGRCRIMYGSGVSHSVRACDSVKL